MRPVDFRIQLHKIHCFDEGDGIGNAEPYLWAVFFKIDGESAVVDTDDLFQLKGTAQVFGTVGDHGNLLTQDVDAGDDVSIPPQFGYADTLLSIPFVGSHAENGEISGVVGCAVILLEQDNTSDSAVASGHAELSISVQAALNHLITTLNFSHQVPTPEELDALKKQVASAVKDAIGRDTSVFDWISGGGNMDDLVGSEVFYYSQADLLSYGPGGTTLDRRWQDEGDWELTGRAQVTWSWSAWEDLGGILTSAPAVASGHENRLNCFVRGSDNHMWHKQWDGSAWSTWKDLGGPPAPPIVSEGESLSAALVSPTVSFGQLASAPAAVSWGPNRIDCFVRGMNRHMWHKWWDGSAWSVWEDLGGTLTSAPAVASGHENRLDCFVRGIDDHMWHKWWDGSAWSTWEDLGGTLTSAPAAVSWGPNRVDCFVRGIDNHMWHKWWDGSAWSDWEDLGGTLTSAPAVASGYENRLNCFVRGTDNHMWHKWWDGSAWSDWEDLGGLLTDAPAAVSWGPGRIDCFVRSTDNHMWHKSWG